MWETRKKMYERLESRDSAKDAGDSEGGVNYEGRTNTYTTVTTRNEARETRRRRCSMRSEYLVNCYDARKNVRDSKRVVRGSKGNVTCEEQRPPR